MGHLVTLELARCIGDLKHFVYASSSSIYGGNRKLPFALNDPVDHPVSLYAATKQAYELMAETYTHLFGVKATGLHYFTVYGPWGRPDMSPYIFAKAIREGRTLQLYHCGLVKRDYSYIDDIVTGTITILDRPAGKIGHHIYNLGASHSEEMVHLVSLLERGLGPQAKIELMPGDAFDIQETAADISDTSRDFGWPPKVSVEEGVPRFVDWFKTYNGFCLVSNSSESRIARTTRFAKSGCARADSP